MARWVVVDEEWLNDEIRAIADAVRSKMPKSKLEEMAAKWEELFSGTGEECPQEIIDNPPFFFSPFETALDWANAYHDAHENEAQEK